MKSAAAILLQHGQPLLIDELEYGDPEPDQVLVRLFASGICHSQLHQIRDPNSPTPLLLGHEATGVVLQCGQAVTHVREGDHVIVTWVPRDARPGMPPATPPAVRWRGKAFLFERSPIFTWARHTLVDARFVVAIPRDVATDVTAIIGCAVLTGAGAVLNTARVRPGESVAIFGVGGVGLSAVQAAANVGAHPIIAVDLSEEKLAFAQRFGATHGLNAATTDVVSEIQQLTGGGVDYAFDAIGAPQTQVQILQVTRPGILGFGDGGMSILVGIPQQPVSLDLKTLVRGQKIYRGSWGGSTRPERDFPLYIRWFQEGKLPLEALVTRRYSLEQINEAVEELAQGRVLGRSILELK